MHCMSHSRARSRRPQERLEAAVSGPESSPKVVFLELFLGPSSFPLSKKEKLFLFPLPLLPSQWLWISAQLPVCLGNCKNFEHLAAPASEAWLQAPGLSRGNSLERAWRRTGICRCCMMFLKRGGRWRWTCKRCSWQSLTSFNGSVLVGS